MSRQYRCNSCNEATPLIIKTDKLYGEFRHSYGECQKCGYKSTVYYTNKKIRSMLSKQKQMPGGDKKVKFTEKLDKEVALLRERFEKVGGPYLIICEGGVSMKIPTDNPELVGATVNMKAKFRLTFKIKLKLIMLGLRICPKYIIKKQFYEKLVADLSDNFDKYFVVTLSH